MSRAFLPALKPKFVLLNPLHMKIFSFLCPVTIVTYQEIHKIRPRNSLQTFCMVESMSWMF
jgi:hypothetical protein